MAQFPRVDVAGQHDRCHRCPSCRFGEVVSNGTIIVRLAAEKVNRAKFPKIFEVVDSGFVAKAYALGVGYGLMLGGQAVLRGMEKSLPIELPEATPDENAAFWKWLYGDEAPNLTPPSDGGIIAVEYSNDLREIEIATEPDLAHMSPRHHDRVAPG